MGWLSRQLAKLGASDAIDGVTTLGLAGTSNSLAYRVHEIEKHFHSYERWFEAAAVPDGEDHVADAAGTGGGAFQIDAGNDDWGSWVQILGADDTPAQTSMVKFDFHKLLITAAERNEIYVIQIGVGASGAAALSAEDYTEVVFKPINNQGDSGPVEVMMARAYSGSKVWARCICPGQNTATIDFMIGLHEYAG